MTYSWVVVTPAHNEAEKLPRLALSLQSQIRNPISLWVIVDDGSVDGTYEVASNFEMPMPVVVVRRKNSGGLIGGSAFKAWQHGVDHALINLNKQFDFIMKLDADVVLDSSYFANLELYEEGAGVLGGVIAQQSHREQTVHVPGPVKAYSSNAYKALKDVPREVGFDVIDEVAVRLAELPVVVVRAAKFDMLRSIGASEGSVHGRFRNGRVCRFTGYWYPYLLIHVLRYCFRKPLLVGGAAVLWGWLRAGIGPYAPYLRKAHAAQQRQKLIAIVRNPYLGLRSTYTISPRSVYDTRDQGGVGK